MKKIIFPLFLSLLLSGCNWNLLNRQQPAALKINTTPQATVFIDGKHSGTTPYSNEQLEAGEITLKLVPEQASSQAVAFEGLVELTSGVVTVINHQFATDQTSSSGEMLTLQPNNRSVASLSIVSQPDASSVRLDGESKGFTPLVVEQVEPGDHQLLISSPGYQERAISIKTETGYRLTVSAQLAKEAVLPEDTPGDTPEASPSAKTPTPSDNKIKPVASVSPTKTASPTPSKTASKPTPAKPYVKINDTPTGWLRVRSEPSLSGEEISKVEPGETFPLKETQSGWYQIELDKDTLGWIASQYAEKYE